MSRIDDIKEKAISKNDPLAQNNLGMCFLAGDGVAKDYKKAFFWFSKAAKSDYARPKINLGICYKEGIGTKQDIEKAVELFEEAYECGETSVAKDLAEMYFNGDGVKKDARKAFKWYVKAADDGDIDATFQVGMCYLNGTACDKDRKKAEEYLRVAAVAGVKEAQEILAKEFKVVGDYVDKKTTNRRIRPTDEEKISEAEIELNNLIGLASVKRQVQKIKAFVAKNKDSKINLHMCFNGNPGTGKTMVARIIGKLLHEAGILPKDPSKDKDGFIEADRGDLVGKYQGHTAEKTKALCKKAQGGVLFIDEAYNLSTGDNDNFGQEAVGTLIKEMEDNRGKFCVILAGYTDKMEDMMATNPGFKSRIQFIIDFPDYNRDEIEAIMRRNLRSINPKTPYEIEDDALEECLNIVMSQADDPDFANARTARKLLEDVISDQNVRTRNKKDDYTITMEDVEAYKEEKGIDSTGKRKKHVGGEKDDETVRLTTLGYKKDPKELKKAEEELDKLIGLKSVKMQVKKLKAYLDKNEGEKPNIHMAFTGGPGTGKTVVARLIGKILFHSGVISKPIFGETDRDGLVGSYQGETGKKTHHAVNKTMGGVLFVDEAYNLATDNNDSFGKEAVGALLKDMEDFKGEFCCILAGYTNEMDQLFEVNPGFRSRIKFTINFPDYNRDELREITQLKLKEENGGKYTMTKEVLEDYLDILEYMKENDKSYANARTVRETLGDIIQNQNVRTAGDKRDFVIKAEDLQAFKDEKGFTTKSTTKKNTKNSDNPNLKISYSGYKQDPKQAAEAEAKLNKLVGLERVKREIKKLKIFLIKNKGNKMNIHMAFLGAPGTGKSVVARLMSQILYHSGVLDSSVVVETDREGLVGRYVGETGKKTHGAVETAMGGVLFIDEAYNLVSGDRDEFGSEAVGALLKDMEDYRGEFCTILAGYTKDMERLFKVNQGFKSRVKFIINFPNYTPDELKEITKLMLESEYKENPYTMSPKVLNKFIDVMKALSTREDYANARTIRETLASVVLNQGFRVGEDSDSREIEMEDIETFIEDEGIELKK